MSRYFVHLPPDGSPALFWRGLAGFPGGAIHINLSLLAHAVGDDPSALVPPGGTLVPTQDYLRFSTGSTVVSALQPFAFTPARGNPSRPQGLPIAGTNLQRFLDDPLSGDRMNLSIPFYDEDIKLGSSGGGWFRNNNADNAFHAATDFNTSPGSVFDVCAAAEGTVLARAGDALTLTHTTGTGRTFRTVYLHMDLGSSPHAVGDSVRRGEFLGHTDPTQQPLHLHFGVAVPCPAFTYDGASIASFWHFIDPWGVYDYRADNYLPTTGRIFESPIVGATHTVQWRAQPLARTIPIARTTTGYREIVRVQARTREGTNLGGTFPAEKEQFLVWVGDDPDFFLVPLTQASDRTMEFELVSLLREAFIHRKKVRLEYRYAGNLRYIMAAWANA